MLTGLRRAWRSGGSAGAAAVELALVTPFLLTVSLGGIDYGNLFNDYQALVTATRVGAETARNDTACQSGGYMPSGGSLLVQPTCQQQIQTAMTNSGSFSPGLTFPSNFQLACYCDGDNKACSATVSAPANYSCSTDGRGFNELFITISASQIGVTPLISWPGFPSTISATTVLRLQ